MTGARSDPWDYEDAKECDHPVGNVLFDDFRGIDDDDRLVFWSECHTCGWATLSFVPADGTETVLDLDDDDTYSEWSA